MIPDFAGRAPLSLLCERPGASVLHRLNCEFDGVVSAQMRTRPNEGSHIPASALVNRHGPIESVGECLDSLVISGLQFCGHIDRAETMTGTPDRLRCYETQTSQSRCLAQGETGKTGSLSLSLRARARCTHTHIARAW